MIWQRLKLDPFWKAIPVVAVMFTVALRLAGSSGDPMATKVIAAVMCGTIPFVWLVLPPFRQRYTLLDVTLPIAGRQLFLARVAFLLAFLWVPLLGAIAVNLFLEGSRTWAESLPMLECGALVTVGLILVQTFDVREMNPPVWLVILVAAASLFLLPRAVKLNLPGSAAMILAVLGGSTLVSAALILKGWTQVPKSFQVAPAEADAEETVDMRSVLTENAPPASPLWRVFRALYVRPSKIGGGLILAAIAASLYKNVGWAVIPVGLAFPYPMEMRWLLPLPIPSRKLFWLSSFQSVIPALAGLLAGAAMISFGSNSPAVKTGHERAEDGLFAVANESGTLNVYIPAGYWRWARSGSAPSVEAPWGESFRPETQRWLGLVFYNPYSVGRASSQQYLEWQFLRATQAVYGHPVSVSGAGELLRMRPIKRQLRTQLTMLGTALLYCLIQMCWSQFCWGKHLRYAGTGLRFFLAFAPWLLGFALLLASPPVGNGGSFVFDGIISQLASALPENLWLLAIVAAVPMAGLYWLAEKLSGEMEFMQMNWQMEAAMRQRQQKLSK